MGVLKQVNGNKHAVVESNFLAGRRTGHVKAQLGLNEDQFSNDVKAENGMLLIYDTVNQVVSLPVNAASAVMLHFSVEKEYDRLRPGLNNFALAPGEFYPRLYGLYPGDTWTTDAVRLVAGTATDEEIEAAYETLEPSNTNVYAVGTDGFLNLVGVAAGTEPVRVKVISKTTLPNGGLAVKLEVV